MATLADALRHPAERPEGDVDARARALAMEMEALTRALRDVTVQVRAHARSGSVGSGVLWPPGVVVTNAHVARGGRALVELADGRLHHARVAARDDRDDLAVLHIDDAPTVVAEPGDARPLRAGELLVAFGHPLGIPNALALGIVHGIARGDDGAPRWVVADLRLAPGNSGGPLADIAGRVVGLNTMIVRGLGVAIPAERVSRFVRAAMASG